MEYLRNLEIQEYQLIPCSIKRNYVKTALCDLGAGVSAMPLSLYRRLDLNKLTPTKISLQMVDKSAVIHVGICEDVSVVVANVTILMNFVILDIPEDDSMPIILGRLSLNTAGAVIDCNKGNFIFHVNDNEHMVHYRKNNLKLIASTLLEKLQLLLLEVLHSLFLLSKGYMIFLLLGKHISPLR